MPSELRTRPKSTVMKLGMGFSLGTWYWSGDGLVGGFEVGGVVEELVGESGAGARPDRRESSREKKQGVSATRNSILVRVRAVEPGEKVVVLRRGEPRVELVAVGLQHGS